MDKEKFVSFEQKLFYFWLLFTLSIGPILAISVGGWNYYRKVNNFQEYMEETSTLLKQKITFLASPLKKDEILGLLKLAVSFKEIQGLEFFDGQGQLLFKHQSKGENLVNIEKEIFSQGQLLGNLKVHFTKTPMYESLKRQTSTIFLILFLYSFLVGLFFVSQIHLKILLPLKQIYGFLLDFDLNQLRDFKKLALKRNKYFRGRDQIDVIADAVSELSFKIVQKNREEQDRVQIIEMEVLKRTEDLLKEKQESSKAVLDKNHLMGRIGHEIRNPLNTIVGLSDVLLKETEEVEREAIADSISKTSQMLLQMANDLFDFSEAELGKLRIQPNTVEVKGLFASLDKMYRRKIQKKGPEFILKIPLSLPEFLSFDSLRFSQILWNLLENALHFTEKGRIVLEVTFKGQDRLKVVVEDTGSGIPPEKWQQVFEEYREADVNRKGLGVGLFMCKKLAELMGGDIRIEKKRTPGTRFVLEVMAPVTEGGWVSEEDSQNVFFQGQKVLIIDDEKVNRDMIRWGLRSSNLNLLFAKDGKEGINKALLDMPDLILLSIKEGGETLKLFQLYEKLKAIPIIILMEANQDLNELKGLYLDSLKGPLLQKKLVDVLALHLSHHLEKRKEISQEPSEEMLSEEFLKIFQEKFKPWIDHLLEIMSIQEIGSFNKELQTLAEKFQAQKVLKRCSKLDKTLRLFHVEGIEKNLREMASL